MSNRKKRLKDLVEKFESYYNSGNFDSSSEATARTWIEQMLEIFGWDVSNPVEVDQESLISDEAKQRMLEIESSHKTPDYALMLGEEVLGYLDAKKVDIDLSSCKKSAFQIRSYGWSSNTPCCFLTNFKELLIFDSRFMPQKGDLSDTARAYYFTFEDYVDNFSVIEDHLLKKNVQERKLDSLYSKYENVRGTKSLDEEFAELLGEWRLKFAEEVYQQNSSVDAEEIQYEVQVLLDQLIFLRVAEGKNIEPFGQLKTIASKKNAYKYFKKFCDSALKNKFGGYLFEKLKPKLKFNINDELFSEFILKLYYPYPYRFEVIPADLLGSMYEQYLGKKLVIENDKIQDAFKAEYQKTKGAVYTPKYVVDTICRSTIKPLINRGSIRSIINLDVIDPSCGSGSFLLGVFDFLEGEIKHIIRSKKEKIEKKYDDWYTIDPKRNKVHLKVSAKRYIINSCIYGIDIDPQAVEVSRLSLALKALEGCESEPSRLLELDVLEPKVLGSIGENIKNGNSLVDSGILSRFEELSDDIEAMDKLRIFDWEQEFEAVFASKGGFDAVVGNPPYIETKHYKEESPYLHKLITLRSNREFETAGGGKLDVAMPFIERGLKKTNAKGRMAYIVTNRFFKTDYGKASRQYLSDNKYIESIFDFAELKVFKGRSTYTCILNLTKKPNDSLKYETVSSLENIEHRLPMIFKDKAQWSKFNYSSIDQNPWSFSNPDLLNLKDDLLKRHKAIKDQENVHLKVGLQVTWDKVYHIRPLKIDRKYLIGINGLGEHVRVELDSCRPMICNEKFYSFRQAKADVYAIFPYEIKNGKDSEIKFSDYKSRFPQAGKYLEENKEKVIEEVDTVDGDDEWHLYMYKKNLVAQSKPKILFPTTITDTVSTVDEKGQVYQDNVRVCSMIIDGASIELYWAIAGIFNSTLINCLAKVTTNPLQEGHVQFNKQFIEPLPMSVEVLQNEKASLKRLAKISKDIYSLQERYIATTSSNTKNSIRKSMSLKWADLDEVVENSIYKLSPDEKSILASYPRRVDRFDYFEKLIEEQESA